MPRTTESSHNPLFKSDGIFFEAEIFVKENFVVPTEYQAGDDGKSMRLFSNIIAVNFDALVQPEHQGFYYLVEYASERHFSTASSTSSSLENTFPAQEYFRFACAALLVAYLSVTDYVRGNANNPSPTAPPSEVVPVENLRDLIVRATARVGFLELLGTSY
ncbi:hypothetical protein AAG570_000714 [Ranatra chinensis]|uniref:Uncharacterized protein n=1 Tax=Ranatra chinensis TaxID=642074 RepID=A0ABD0YXV7_9HEMI